MVSLPHTHLLHQLAINDAAITLEQLHGLTAPGSCIRLRLALHGGRHGRVDVLRPLDGQHVDGRCTGRVTGERGVVLQTITGAILCA